MATAPDNTSTFAGIGLDTASRAQLQLQAEQVAAFVRLPFRSATWRGSAGSWQGAGIGSSIDFQDHRQYLPGDDPRYINWQAYARTGHYTMKLYREEVSPQLDIVLDVSPSMFVSQEKVQRVVELFHFVAASALTAGAAVRCYQVTPAGIEPLELEAIRSGRWELMRGEPVDEGASEIPALAAVPWRTHALRVLVSDLLFAGSPDAILSSFAQPKSRLLVFCPWCASELSPDWVGNVELENCESGDRRELRFTDRQLEAYQQRYRLHFSLWQEACAKRGYGFARVDSKQSLQAALLQEPLECGLVELWN